jgi:hypothetical protein
MNMIIDNIFVKVNTMLAEERYKDAAEEMAAWLPAPLTRYYLENAPYQKTLRKPEFDELWQFQLAKLSLKESPEFKFVSQPGIGDADLFLGYVCYLLALKKKQENNLGEYKRYLKNAMVHYSIQAHQTCLHEIIFAENMDFQAIYEDVSRLMEGWVEFANLQGTPGYLLLASAYLQLTKSASETENKDHLHTAYFSAWKYLHLAKLSEPFCEAAINNAYFGKGLRLSNPLHLQSIDEMIMGCHSIAKNVLTEADQYSAESEAKRLFAALTRSYKSPSWSLSVETEIEENHELSSDNTSHLPQIL